MATPVVEVLIQDKRWGNAVSNLEVLIQTVCESAWKKAGVSKLGIPMISLFLDNDASIKVINKEYRRIDKPTNVLSFPSMEEDVIGVADVPFLVGDIIIALETTQQEAKESEISLGDHFAHLLVHGILHLAGFDHMNDEEAMEMESLEVDILRGLGIKNPYQDKDLL